MSETPETPEADSGRLPDAACSSRPTCLWCKLARPAEGVIHRDGRDYYFCRRHIEEFRRPSDTVIAGWANPKLSAWLGHSGPCEKDFESMNTTEKALELCHAIEAAGASEQLTKCSVLASALRAEVAQLETVAAGMEAERNKIRKERDIAVENHWRAIARAEAAEKQLNEMEDEVINGDSE